MPNEPNLVPIDDLDTNIKAYLAAVSHAEQWQTTAEALKEQIRQIVEERAGENDSPDGKRTTYGTVKGSRVITYTEYLESRFDKDKARAEYPEVIDKFTTKRPKSRFVISE